MSLYTTASLASIDGRLTDLAQRRKTALARGDLAAAVLLMGRIDGVLDDRLKLMKAAGR